MSNTKKQEDLEAIVKQITDEQIQSSSHSVPELLSGSKDMSIEEVMTNQSCFTAAVQLGNSPTMKFGGELNKYVQFVTMFRNTFDKTIKDSSALYALLVRHAYGQAKKCY